MSLRDKLNPLVIINKNCSQEAFSVMIGRKSSADNQSENSLQKGKRKKKKEVNEPVRDEENYISYRPADYQSEQGYAFYTCDLSGLSLTFI